LTTLRIVTSNIQKSTSLADKTLITKKVYAEAFTSGPTPVVLFQEINEVVRPGAHQAVRDGEPSGTTHLFSSTPIPIAVPSRFNTYDAVSGNTLPEVTFADGTTDAARFWARVRIEDKNYPDLKQSYVLNTHFPAGASWTTDINTLTGTAKSVLQARRDRWVSHFNQVQAVIKGLRDADFTVFWGGDFNRNDSGMPEFFTAEKQAVGEYAVDKLYVLDRRVDTSLNVTGTVNTTTGFAYSDHDAKYAGWSLSNRP
jgi:hypothetical protein